MLRNSAKAPGRLTPTPKVLRHRCRRPARQLRQWPQVTWPSPETRSPIVEAAHLLAHGDDLADIFMADMHAERHGLRRPFIPFPDMDVGAADRGLADADEDVVMPDLGLRHVGEREAGAGLFFDEGFHDDSFLRSPRALCRPWQRRRWRGRYLLGLWAADICVRMRAWPLGTTG